MPKINPEVLKTLTNKFSTPAEIDEAVKAIPQKDIKAYEVECFKKTGQTIMNIAALGVRGEFADKAKTLLAAGFDPNRQERAFGNTTLQLLIGNEDFENARKLVDLAKGKVNLAIADKEGKTPVILLSKMGTKNATDFACYLLSKNPDNLMAKDRGGLRVDQYAMVLGNIQLLEALAKTGKFSFADMDRELSGLLQKVSINDVLRSVSIEPSRAENAQQNNLVDYNGQPICVLNPGLEVIDIVAKRKKVSGNKLRSLKELDFVDPTKLRETRDIKSSISPSLKEAFFQQYSGLSKKSVLQKCEEGQQQLVTNPKLKRNLQSQSWTSYTQNSANHELKSGPLSFLEPGDAAKAAQVSKASHSSTQPFLDAFCRKSQQSQNPSVSFDQ
ncbi:ankyrin repeat domain-containing protein [Piscirickettsia litoralis]|uniref:Uncharacterized protein n=1 Tax=Piscirickettsia litoralis TaxID=1891921 RepID=A0ABX3A2A9_9GAMM|nr:ankyrin repeat domain-containing protein [Piscirickettsia litoralis]ODN42367.1 hypothetical protein BGC07_04750 [Piscirickettsia litoralis]